MKLEDIVNVGDLLENIAATQAALQRSEALNRGILGSLTGHLVVLDTSGVIIGANEGWYRYCEEIGEEALDRIGIGANYLDQLKASASAGDRQALEQAVGIQAVLSGQLPRFVYEYKAAIPNAERWYLMRVSPLRIREGGVVINNEDISIIKQVEQELRRSDANLLTMFNSTNMGFVLIDPDYTIRACNAVAVKRARLLYQTSTMTTGESMLHFVDPAQRDMFTSQFQRCLAGEYVVTEQQVMSEGEVIYFEVRFNPVIDESDHVWGVCYITDNITSRRKMEISLLETLEKERELSEMKSRFVATASHEFRTPLTTIMSSAELLKQFRDRMTPDRVEDHLLRIIRQVKYMTTLIDDLLVLGKAQSGKLEFTPQLLDINALCLEILDHMGETLKNSVQVNYVSQYTCDLRPFDPRLLRLIVSNLLSNAAKYSPKGSQVLFELRCAPAETVLIVQDHGMGIPEKDLLHIFKPFYRAANVGTIGGTGLGLSIIRQAVELHGGAVELESQEGTGTKFTVRLPLPAEAAR